MLRRIELLVYNILTYGVTSPKIENWNQIHHAQGNSLSQWVKLIQLKLMRWTLLSQDNRAMACVAYVIITLVQNVNILKSTDNVTIRTSFYVSFECSLVLKSIFTYSVADGCCCCCALVDLDVRPKHTVSLVNRSSHVAPQLTHRRMATYLTICGLLGHLWCQIWFALIVRHQETVLLCSQIVTSLHAHFEIFETILVLVWGSEK